MYRRMHIVCLYYRNLWYIIQGIDGFDGKPDRDVTATVIRPGLVLPPTIYFVAGWQRCRLRTTEETLGARQSEVK